jgi:hypothetical protein
MKSRQIRTSNQFGRKLVHVPVGRNGEKEAVLYKEDWDTLNELGVSPNWCTIGNSVASRGGGKACLLARVIADLKAGERIIYRDGNGLNLRRENLRKQAKGWSLHHDRERLLDLALRRRDDQ